jgi:hypothetical protein
VPEEAVVIVDALPLEASDCSQYRRVGLRSVLPMVVRLRIEITETHVDGWVVFINLVSQT